MKQFDYLIIGGGVAGTTAAETIRNNDPKASILILSEEEHPLYSRVLLPYFLQDRKQKSEIFLKNKDWYKERKIQLLTGFEATHLDPLEKIVEISKGDKVSYQKLLIASGGKPHRLNIKGQDKKGICYLRTLEDAQSIKKRLKEIGREEKGVVIGGGFIALDFIETFVDFGLETSVVLIEDYFWQEKVDKGSAELIESFLTGNGVKILRREEAREFLGKNGVERIKMKSGEIIDTQIVGIGAGCDFNLEWLFGSGLEIGNGIKTNEYLETDVKDIWAAGDVAEFRDVLFGRQHTLGNWINATTQGKIVGTNMCGKRQIFETVSAYSDSFFGNHVSLVGLVDLSDCDRIVRRSKDKKRDLTTFFFRSGRLIGAVIINRMFEQGTVSLLVKNKTDLSKMVDNLTDPDFDLAKLARKN